MPTIAGTVETGGHEAFVNSHLVFEERDFQIVGAQMTAKLLQTVVCFPERVVRGVALSPRLANETEDEVRLVREQRRLGVGQLHERVGARALGRVEVSGLELEARHEQVTERGL